MQWIVKKSKGYPSSLNFTFNMAFDFFNKMILTFEQRSPKKYYIINISDIDSQSNKDYKQKLETKKEGKKKEATKP